MLNLHCDEVSRLVSDSFERDQTRLERLAWRSHVAYCSACRRYRSQVAVFRQAMHQLETRLEADAPWPGPGLPSEVRERIKRALREG
jgi:predicted anti-sigma-YlaC factor YlaD